MSGAWTTLTVKDGGGTSRTMRVWDESGAGTGPFSFGPTAADGSGGGVIPAIKAASTAPIATDPALVVAISPNSVNANGPATPANSAPVIPAATTTTVAVSPTVTAGAYSGGNVIGGIMTFASLLDSVRFAGILESITVKFKGTAATSTVTVNLFKASPSNGTYTDKTAPTWNAADMANMLGSYTLSPISNLGTMAIYNLDGIGKAIQGASASLFAVATVSSAVTPASTSDFTVELTVLPG